MGAEAKFKAGDFVTHDKFGVGEIKEVCEDEGYYKISFYATGEHRVRFSTFLRPRKNGDYKRDVRKGDRCIEITFHRYGSNKIELKEDFSVERFNELVSCKTMEYDDVEYRLEHFYVYSIHQKLLVIEFDRRIIGRESSINASFVFIDKGFTRKLLDEGANIEEFGGCINTEDEIADFAFEVLKLYNKNIEL